MSVLLATTEGLKSSFNSSFVINSKDGTTLTSLNEKNLREIGFDQV